MNGYGSYLPAAFTAENGPKVDRLEFTYTLKASDTWLKEHANSEFDTDVYNSAVIKDNTMDHWNTEAHVPYFPNRLTKSAKQDGTSNLITFTLEINSVGADLDPARDYLIITDESTGIQIRADKITVTDGDGKELKGIGNTTIDADLGENEWGLLPTEDEHQYRLKVPDGKVLHITYEALITEMGTVTVTNKASIDGVARTDSSYEESLKVDSVHASGEVGSHQLTIEKTDSERISKKLAKAEFRFYIVRGEDSGLTETKKITVGGREYSCHSDKAWTFTTDDNGQYTIKGWNLEPGNYYILEELTAPAGYEMLEEPVLFYYGLKNEEVDSTVAIAPPDGILTVGDPPVQYRLPESGGPGTIFYIVTGLALVLGSAALLAAKKKARRAR